MNKEGFRKYLLKNEVPKDKISEYFTRLDEFQEFLKRENLSIDSIPEGKIIDYTEMLVENETDYILEFIRALYNYADFAINYNYSKELIDIIEGHDAMDNLYQRISEKFGEEKRDEIFKDMKIPPLGVHPEKKPKFTATILKKMEENLEEEQIIELLSPCLHGRPIEPIKKDREDFLKLGNIDEFLVLKKKEFVERLQKHRDAGTLEYAQYVDDDVIDYVKNSVTITPGIREGDKIIVTKIPYQMQQFLNTEDEKMKRYYSCYCAWVRGAIKKGEEQDISKNFCHCSAGFFKQYWDIIFDQSVRVEPIETPLTGALVCKFEVRIPKEYQ